MISGDVGGVIDVDWGKLLTVLLSGLAPVRPQFALIAAVIIVVGVLLPGRGPGLFQRRDPWCRFKSLVQVPPAQLEVQLP